MELISIFFTSLIIAFSGAMMPGPLLTVTITESTHKGFFAGPLLIIGHGILEIILIIALLFGLAPLFNSQLFFLIIAFSGSAIMIWMAWSMFKSISSLSIDNNAKYERKNNLIVTGIIMSVANPYWTIWWATIGLGYIIFAQQYGWIGIILFFSGHILGDFIWYSSISFAVSKGKKLFTDKIYRLLIAICASFLLLFSIYLIFMAISKL